MVACNADKRSVRFRVIHPFDSGEPGISLTCTDPADCLARNSYKERKCQAQVDELYKCCNMFYERQGDGAHTVSCPKASLLRLKMEQRAQGA